MTSGTKTALLDAAEQAARRRGFDGFSFADMAPEVGIRKASIHHHFPTKALLAKALIARYHAEMEATCAAITALHPTGGGRLGAMIATYRAALDEGRCLCLCVALSVARDSLPEDLPSALVGFRAMMRDWLAEAFALGAADGSILRVTDAKAEASATLALMEGAHLAARAMQDVAQFDAALATLSQRITKGLAIG